jgi:hypothetical protein
VFRYTWLGKGKKIEVGTFPKVSLAEARAAWTKYTAWMADDKDPANMQETETRKAADEAVTVETYLRKKEKKEAKRRPRTKRAYARYWEMIRKAVGRRPASEVTRRELKEKLQIEEMYYKNHADCMQLCSQLHAISKMVQIDFHLPVNAGADLTSGFPRQGMSTLSSRPRRCTTANSRPLLTRVGNTECVLAPAKAPTRMLRCFVFAYL